MAVGGGGWNSLKLREGGGMNILENLGGAHNVLKVHKGLQKLELLYLKYVGQ